MPDSLDSIPARHRPILGVGVVLTDTRGHVLLGHRINAGETPSWSLAGGKCDAGESFEQAARRELFEETGLAVAGPIAVIAMMLDAAAGQPRLTAVAQAAVAEPLIARVTEPDRFDAWQWFDPAMHPTPLFASSADALAVALGLGGARGFVYRVRG